MRRTPYNQYDAIVRPLTAWLQERGVRFEMGTQVTDLDFRQRGRTRSAERIHYMHGGTRESVAVPERDFVFVTLGSMTADSSLGSMTTAPRLEATKSGGS